MFIDETKVEKRRFRRVRFSEPVHYQLKETSRFGGCLSLDISEGGMKINFDDFIPLNTEIALQLKLTGIPRIIDLLGKVVWLQQVPFSERYHVGLRFEQSDHVSHEEIREYIRSYPA